MKEKKSFVVTIEPMRYVVHVLYLFSEKDLQNYSDKHFDGCEVDRPEKFDAVCWHLRSESGRRVCLIDFHKKLNKNDMCDVEMILHECIHAILRNFRDHDIEVHSYDNEEFYCYYISFLFKKVMEGLFKKDGKTNRSQRH